MTEYATLGCRILIVDDEPANVRLLERILQGAGYTELYTTTDGRAVADLYRQIQPDIVLLDLHMPHLDGLAVLGQLQDLIPANAFVPVLVLTADATSRAREQALSTGAKDFLLKPFDRTEVLLRIHNLLETRALHVEIEKHNHDLREQLRVQVERDAGEAAEQAARYDRIRAVLDDGGPTMLFQPIADLVTGRVVGAEALARFAQAPRRPPDLWFAEASSVGLGAELELAAVKAALRRLHELPPDAYLAVNVSPPTVHSDEFTKILARSPARGSWSRSPNTSSSRTTPTSWTR
jgi:CheY-like chemotaxis protein